MECIKKNLPSNWQVFNDAEQLAQALSQTILKTAEDAIAEKGEFHFIAAGGTTPNRCYKLLSKAQSDWDNWHIYLGDERVLPFTNSERNSQALLTHWLSNNDIPVRQVHFINTEAGMQKSAETYAEIIEAVESFDLCLLGMGEDGHTASLFPGHENASSVSTIGAEGLVITESDSPKPPAQRVSLNYPAFKKCKRVIKVVTGESKKPIVSDILLENADFPINRAEAEQSEFWVSQDVLT